MRLPRESGTVEARGVVVIGLVIALVAATSVGVASAQRAQTPSTVDSCTTIDSSGRYVLSQNITSTIEGADESCIEITASNVVLDGAGHTLTGSGAGHGVEVNGSGSNVSNVTVKRLYASNWSIGIFYLGTDNGTIRGTVTDNNTEGIALGAASGNELVGNTAYNNAIGVAVGGESQNNTIRKTVAVGNKWGIHFERESANNTVRNSVARNNTRWDYYAGRNDAENTVTDLRMATATVSFSGRNVALRSVSSLPALPHGTGNLNRYIEVSRTRGGPSSLSLTMEYATEKSVSLWRSDGQHWSSVDRARVDASANTVSVSNLTEFGIVAVLADAPNGDRGPVTVTTDQPVSVQRALTTVPQPTPTATPNTEGSPHAGTSTAVASRPPTATATSTASGETVMTGMANTTIGTGAHAESAVSGTDGFGSNPVRLVFVFVGLVGLVALCVVAVWERTAGRDGRI